MVSPVPGSPCCRARQRWPPGHLARRLRRLGSAWTMRRWSSAGLQEGSPGSGAPFLMANMLLIVWQEGHSELAGIGSHASARATEVNTTADDGQAFVPDREHRTPDTEYRRPLKLTRDPEVPGEDGRIPPRCTMRWQPVPPLDRIYTPACRRAQIRPNMYR